jgi:hypothetical protein
LGTITYCFRKSGKDGCVEVRMSRAGGICSKLSSEHLAANSEHLISESMQGDPLREIAEKVSSKRKMSKEVVEATILQLCDERYADPLPKLEHDVEEYAAMFEEHLKRMGVAWE